MEEYRRDSPFQRPLGREFDPLFVRALYLFVERLDPVVVANGRPSPSGKSRKVGTPSAF